MSFPEIFTFITVSLLFSFMFTYFGFPKWFKQTIKNPYKLRIKELNNGQFIPQFRLVFVPIWFNFDNTERTRFNPPPYSFSTMNEAGTFLRDKLEERKKNRTKQIHKLELTKDEYISIK